MLGDAVIEEKTGWRVVPIIGRNKEKPVWWGETPGADHRIEPSLLWFLFG
jgi:hypothetical protein